MPEVGHVSHDADDDDAVPERNDRIGSRRSDEPHVRSECGGEASRRHACRPPSPGSRTTSASARACRVVLEVGTHSPWVSRLLAELGHEAIVANPSAMFGRAPRRRRRNDRLDAQFLARQGRADVELLYPITHRSAEAQRDLESLRARDQLVAVRTKLINHVRGTVKSTGARLPAVPPRRLQRAAGDAPPALAPALTPLLDVIADLSRRIAPAETQLAARHARAVSRGGAAAAAGGRGPAHRARLRPADRGPARGFGRVATWGPTFGLVPRLDESGDSTPQLRISKAGDEFGRRLLVSAAHYILGPVRARV